jgi:monovalent cation:H+ antiporter-2, CPA2 family
MHNFDLILTLAAGLIAALALGYLTHRLGWSPIVGYLLAGILVGPHTPGFVANHELAGQLAEVGVILLMFGVGLHFHIRDLLAVRRAAVTGAICQSIVATLVGALAARAFGWTWLAGIIFGLALSVASTVVLTRVLSDSNGLRSPAGRIAIGWLVVEDIFTVLVLVILPAILPGSAQVQGSGLPLALALAILKLAAFVAVMFLVGRRLIPRLLSGAAATHSRELFTLSVLAVALGIAVVSARFLGVSMALGAFMAGMAVGQSEFSARAAAEAMPMRDAFAVMFFISIGMLFNPWQALHSPWLMVAALAIVVIGKPLAAFAIMAVLGYSSRIGLGVAIALAQIGEFSFLVAGLARQLGVLPETAMHALVAAAIASIILNPMLYRTLGSMEAFLERRPRLWRILNRSGTAQPEDGEPRSTTPAHRAVVVGHGPIGKAVARLLRERGIEPTIIEMNIATYRSLLGAGHASVYGDANQPEVLRQAGIAGAGNFILSASGAAGSIDAIRAAREINPGIHVVSRADYLAQTQSLRGAGADEVFSGEGEVALAIADSILRRLGATPEQLDEERARLRADLTSPG